MGGPLEDTMVYDPADEKPKTEVGLVFELGLDPAAYLEVVEPINTEVGLLGRSPGLYAKSTFKLLEADVSVSLR